jgi:hypothetical protein
MSVMDDRSIKKLSTLFEDRYESLRSDLWDRLNPKDHSDLFERAVEEAWAERLNGLDCAVLDHSDILEDFQDIVNKSAQGRVCFYSEDSQGFILVPLELAKKALVLGGLPDSWFPEEATS